MKEVRFSYIGGRNYIDIAQIGCRTLLSLGIDVDRDPVTDISIKVLQPVSGLAIAMKWSEWQNRSFTNTETLVDFSFHFGGELHRYVLTRPRDEVPPQLGKPEPEYLKGVHWDFQNQTLFWKKILDIEGMAPFIMMVMGRILVQSVFESQKPRGISLEVKRLPDRSEISKLWARPLRGPIKGFAIIEYGIGEEKVGISKVKI